MRLGTLILALLLAGTPVSAAETPRAVSPEQKMIEEIETACRARIRVQIAAVKSFAARAGVGATFGYMQDGVPHKATEEELEQWYVFHCTSRILEIIKASSSKQLV